MYPPGLSCARTAAWMKAETTKTPPSTSKKRFVMRTPLRFRSDCRNQGFDVSEGKCESLQAIRIAFNGRDVVGHHHPVVSNFLLHAHRLQHIDVAVVNERLAEVEKPAGNITEMDVEDLVP